MRRNPAIDVAAVVLLLAGCGQPELPEMPPPAVQYREVASKPVATSFEFVARARAREDTDIRARITGTLIERNFEEGQFVDADALLFRIDPRPYEAALSSARAQLAQANAALEVAERNAKRAEELLPNGYISKSEMDKLIGERDSARASVESARAAVSKAEIDVGFTEVRAPFAGRTGRSNLSIGDLVDPGAGPLVTLVQSDPMLVDFDVDEATLATALKANQDRIAAGEAPIQYTPTLKLITGDTYAQPGVIDYANNRVDPTTGTVTVTASFPNPDSVLVPGQFARIALRRGEPELRLLVPQSSVLEDMQGRYVFVLDDQGVVGRKNVTLGQRDGPDWVVLDGLAEGDRVIVNGVQKVRPGISATGTPADAG